MGGLEWLSIATTRVGPQLAATAPSPRAGSIRFRPLGGLSRGHVSFTTRRLPRKPIRPGCGLARKSYAGPRWSVGQLLVRLLVRWSRCEPGHAAPNRAGFALE